MRSRILSSLLLATVLAPPAVWAQNADDQQEPESGNETEGSEVVDEQQQPPGQTGKFTLPPGQSGRESAPGEVHTVEKGDTLWDLSQRYLGSPWYWPKVWSYNPEIANPHWIYPGNNVRFFPAGEEVPSRVEAGIGPAPAEMVAEPGEIAESTEIPINGGDLVTVSGKLTYEPKASRTVMTQGFVTSRELDEAGRIEGAATGAEMLSFPDVAYVRFKRKADAKVGDKYVVFHTAQEVKHPVSHKPVGHLTEFVGTLRVVALGDNFVKAQVTETWDAVQRGDLVGPYGERLVEQVVPRRNEKELKGYVITALVPYLTLTAEHHFLVVDKGSADGVQVGNTFTITRQGDPARAQVLKLEPPSFGKKKKEEPLPAENIALCLVTEVKERTSNCVLTTSIEEVSPGDAAVMRVSQSPTAQR
ncbi:LysM peptidoglycan-binding domain-containing protein [Vitiosangium sp. GDMCC 1.1324]|uniref:LysM peptidoglycan-binding domain-containing protein n=1 Tax=Vitiosangium sp. (strain GDMCC 1.1324) TaxID=2138576 RepID=UPI000D381DC0|nr:LysM peptidoglycan-binding domain-containing protein [Vitiosangium sp. GDMCC 1.1324]PTL78281.1 peptidoglycan-binding protein [Vitiosangium sp. GDMCC 1.1324]